MVGLGLRVLVVALCVAFGQAANEASQSLVPHSIDISSSPVPDLAAEELLAEEDDEQLVVYGEHGGLGHIKVGTGATFQQVVEESLALKQQADKAERLLENAFEARLQEFDAQLRLDRTSLKTGTVCSMA